MIKKLLLGLLALSLGIGEARAQIGPGTNGPFYSGNFYQGFVPTAQFWNLLESNKVDYNPSGIAIAYGGTGATTAAQARANLGIPATIGTVTSVGLSLPSIFNVTGSPVTGTGTLTGTLATQSAHAVFVGPAGGSAAAPTFRALVAADLPGTFVNSVSNSDGTLTVTPTTGNVIASLNLSQANTWLAQQTDQGATTTSPGWYAQVAGDTSPRVRVGLNSTDIASIAFGPGNAVRNAFIEWAGAATFRFGAPDSGTPVGQTFGMQNGSGTNVAGAATVFLASRQTGNALPGTIDFQIPQQSGSSGAALGTPVSVFKLFNGNATVCATCSLTYGGVTFNAVVSGSGNLVGSVNSIFTGSTTFNSLLSSGPANATIIDLATNPGSLTGSNAQSMINIAQSLNTSGVVTMFKENATITAAGTGSLLMDLQVNGGSVFKVSAVTNGTVTTSGNIAPNALQLPIGTLLFGNVTNGAVEITNNGGTAGITIDGSTDNTFKCANRANNAGCNFTAATATFGAGSAITSSGPGGALGSNAFTSTAYAPIASPTFTGTQTLTTAVATTLAIGGATIGSDALGVTGTTSFSGTLQMGSGAPIKLNNFLQGTGTGNRLFLDAANNVVQFNAGGSNAINFNLAAANQLKLGAADVDTGVVAQSWAVQNALAGGMSNVAGANFTIAGSQGKGTGAGGSLIFQTAAAGSSGTTVNALATALTIDSTRLATFANGVSVTGPVAVSVGNFSVGSGSYIAWSGSTLINNNNTNGELTISNNAITAGATLDFRSNGVMKIRNLADSADAAITAAGGTFSGGLVVGLNVSLANNQAFQWGANDFIQGNASTHTLSIFTNGSQVISLGSSQQAVFGGQVVMKNYTVGTLPTGITYGRAFITDQLTACAGIGVAPTGGGSVVCPVFYNGSAWVGG